jgi:hypothetical protein
MSGKTFLFYAGELVQVFEPGTFTMDQYTHSTWGWEVYNGCYLYGCPTRFPVKPAWYRGDRTPVLEADVPKELKLLLLIVS